MKILISALMVFVFGFVAEAKSQGQTVEAEAAELLNGANQEAGLSTTGTRRAQQLVFEISSLKLGRHTIGIINRGSGPVAIDALVVNE
jgi:hypothetical protein